MNEKSPVERSANGLIKTGAHTKNNSISKTSDQVTELPGTVISADLAQVHRNEN